MTMPNPVAPPMPDTSSAPAPLALPTKRRIQRGYLGAAVACIVLGALLAVFLWNRYGPAQQYLAIARPVPIGAQLTAEDLVVVRINAAPGLSPIDASRLEEVVGKTAAVDLVAGTLLTDQQLTDKLVPGPGEQLVGLALDKRRLPGQPLRPGDRVLLVATEQDRFAPASQPTKANPESVTYDATVHRVAEPDERGISVIDVIVSDRDGARVAELAAGDDIAVVLMPRQ